MKVGSLSNKIFSVNEEEIHVFEDINDLILLIRNKNLIESKKYAALQKLPTILDPPLSPSKIICTGRNYQSHILEMGGSGVPSEPLFFLKPPSSLIGSGHPIILPSQSHDVHHEIELGVVIGAKGRHIPKENALKYVFGYTVFLDITARDLQRKDQTWFRGKGFDTFGPIGPWIVLKDDVENPNNLKLELRVNEEVRQVGNTRDMIFSVSELIHHVSNVVSLMPGDIIATGTPSGVGKLEKGDVVYSRIENIGILENSVQ